ncbi:dynamin family protein [Jhaorihella thermophila]|uniref:Dynamin family protein n=1 Tax=Jhaorihella thermophila TaxID=488547 RepID=A0A1H5X8Y6_9RHOB|nr:dynamin family protein [Jhaorihella thermophila]SEG08211.1 Dynamin family protein [Jhaorihella thermophila]
MTDTEDTRHSPTAPKRLPRVALMGEFSAGKSTLTNLLLSGTPLPVRVTATRLPPVWISRGQPDAMREDLNGNFWPIDAGDLESVSLDDTRLIRLTMEEEILHLCDLIDMPGISDPNMAPEVWERVLSEADHVVWCTHATQAWRQSEAAVWETVPEELRQKSLLLVTRFDKIVSPQDRDRVLARLRRETRGLFADFFPISLTEALKAGDDRTRWDTSGAEAFVARLVDLLMDPESPGAGTYGTAGERFTRKIRSARMVHATDVPAGTDAGPETPAHVAPRRIRPLGQGARPLAAPRAV